jgi:hypothetical protein
MSFIGGIERGPARQQLLQADTAIPPSFSLSRQGQARKPDQFIALQ